MKLNAPARLVKAVSVLGPLRVTIQPSRGVSSVSLVPFSFASK
jgi:hypothetical protein